MHNPQYLRDYLGMDTPPDVGDMSIYGKSILIIVGNDGQVSGRELAYFLNHIQSLGFPLTVVEELKRFDYRNAKLEDYVASIHHTNTAKMLLYDAIAACYVDGYADKEREAIAVAANILQVDETVRKALEHFVAIDFAVQHGKANNNFPMVESAVREGRIALISPERPKLVVDDVAQAKRFNSTRTGQVALDPLPPEFVRGMDDFKAGMTELESEVGATAESELEEKVALLCESFKELLHISIQDHPDQEDAIGSHAFRNGFSWIMAGNLNDFCYTKSRGFSGDYSTMERIYDNKPMGDGLLGKWVDQWTLNLKFCQSIRDRCRFMHDQILAEFENWTPAEPMPVTSLASGPVRELNQLLQEQPSIRLNFTGIDIDMEANTHAASHVKKSGAAGNGQFLHDNILNMARGRGKTVLPSQQLIYSAGFMDYLTDSEFALLLNWIYGRLLPGGRLVLSQTHPANPDRAYLDHIVEWGLHYRDEAHLRELMGDSKFADQPVEIQFEQAGVQLMLACLKPV